MKWFRLYDDLIYDSKVQHLKSATFKHWINLLCLASKQEPRGSLPILEEISYRLSMKPKRMELILKTLINRSLLDGSIETGLSIHSWMKRQFISDDSNARKSGHMRDSRGTVEGQICPRIVPEVSQDLLKTKELQEKITPSDTDTDTDTEKTTPLSPKRGKPKTGVPSSFPITEEMLLWAKTHVPGVNIENETAAFLDYHGAKGNVFKNWELAWHTWMRNAQKWNNNGHGGNSHATHQLRLTGNETPGSTSKQRNSRGERLYVPKQS